MDKSSKKNTIFPKRLTEARELRGLNQAELASKAGLQASAISHFETGSRKPSFDNLRRLANALNVTTDFLLGRVENVDDLSGADTLHRHFNKLTSEDQKVAEQLIEMLAKKSDNRKQSQEK